MTLMLYETIFLRYFLLPGSRSSRTIDFLSFETRFEGSVEIESLLVQPSFAYWEQFKTCLRMINWEVIFGSLIPMIFSLELPLVITSHNYFHLTGFKDIISYPVRDDKMVNRDILNMIFKMNFTLEHHKIGTVGTASLNPWLRLLPSHKPFELKFGLLWYLFHKELVDAVNTLISVTDVGDRCWRQFMLVTDFTLKCHQHHCSRYSDTDCRLKNFRKLTSSGSL